ncbi:glycosyltransferase [Chryseobacterium nematophagum]|uniref:Glycosyltransferase n=1 Tax=Chryseobacterium nematophagum TaxID=2305228 RepID=A0A3M7TD81_9FLAO|nr:glycosyltransferase [Chryseobacterium nematophagum]RNA61441.1 glycosyltransferase [Chryseobacterium nematophagum]
MKFSVLIAHYNNAAYFKNCYDHLLKQTYPNWEAIIVDDASSEEEKEILKNIIKGDHRFTLYENAQNSGVGITKKKLIELSTGDICGFVDPDDAILPTAIEKCIKVFKAKKNVALTYSKFIMCDEHLTPISPFRSAMQVINNYPYFFNFPIQVGHFAAFRKNIYLETEGMNSDLKIAEDQDLYLKIYEKGKFHFINEANYLYRQHSGGISQNDNKQRSYDYFAKVIFNTMKRRNLTMINGKKIPDHYTTFEEIFQLLEYQNKLPFRIKKKIIITFQKIFG